MSPTNAASTPYAITPRQTVMPSITITSVGIGMPVNLLMIKGVSSYVINKVLTFGGHDAKNVMIISKKNDEIITAIYTELNRGATILKATG